MVEVSNPEKNPPELVCEGRDAESPRVRQSSCPTGTCPSAGRARCRSVEACPSAGVAHRGLVLRRPLRPGRRLRDRWHEGAGPPHTGLQTVSWLFTGEIEHRDTTGAHAMVRPGQLNIMTAGSGIAHSEYSTGETTILHGAQLWVALPDAHRFVSPSFQHYEPPAIEVDGARVLVFLGKALRRDVTGLDVLLPGRRRDQPLSVPASGRRREPGLRARAPLRHGHPDVPRGGAKPGEIIFQPRGTNRVTIEASPSEPTRLLLLGGAPLGEQIVMWWNFIGRTHEEVVDSARDGSASERRAVACSTAPSRRPGPTPCPPPSCPTCASALAADP